MSILRIKTSYFAYDLFYFFKKQVLSTIPDPSILQSTSSGLSVRRMLFTLVPRLITIDEPLTFRSLITVTASPSASSAPLLSTGTFGAASAASLSVHSFWQSMQTFNIPSKYVLSEEHFGQIKISLIIYFF